MKVYMGKIGYMIEGDWCNVLYRPGSDEAEVITPRQWSEMAPDAIELEPARAANMLWDKRLAIQKVMHDEDLPVFAKLLKENVTVNDKMYNSVGGHDTGNGRRPGTMRLEDYMEQQILERIRRDYVSQWVKEVEALTKERLVDETDLQDAADEAVEKLLNVYAEELGVMVIDEATDRIVDSAMSCSDTICEYWSLDSMYELLKGASIVDEVVDEVVDEAVWPDMREVLI